MKRVLLSKSDEYVIERFEFNDKDYVELRQWENAYWVKFLIGGKFEFLEFEFIDQAGAFYEHIVNSVIKKRRIPKPQGIFKNGN